jgi:polyvinyl alcohol dehydrogenase (cytochrome)
MRVQAGGLTLNERNAIAEFLTGKAPAEELVAAPEKNRCTQHNPATLAGPQWNGWGRDLDNSRFQPDAGMSAADVPRLKVKWAFGYRASSVYGQPTVVGGRVYVTSASGRVYSLDARSGCTYWTFDAAASARPAITVAPPSAATPAKLAVFVGDDSATVYALDASSGTLLWKKKLDTHPSARISGAPVFHGERLYVPVSSLEELPAAAPKYECCKFRGSVVALKASDGSLLWQTYTVDEPAHPYRKTKLGTQLYGPAGGAVWSAPTLDPKRNLLYVGTGNSYTDVPATHIDSVLALDLDTGRIRWENPLVTADDWILGCPTATGESGNCPTHIGLDTDVGASPILRTLPDGRQLLLTGQKSGAVHALDPANDGKQVWQAQVGVGTTIGGIEWGPAADGERLYVAVSDVGVTAPDRPGGLSALDIRTGRQIWHAAPPAPVCTWGTRSCTGAQPFPTVNGIEASGGSLDHGGPTVAGGALYVNSGYGRINGQPGNVLLAFTVDGR